MIDIDIVQHDIALALGALPAGTSFGDAKPYYWANSGLGDWTLEIIAVLKAEALLVAHDGDPCELRWVEAN